MFHRFNDAYSELDSIIDEEGGRVGLEIIRTRGNCAFQMRDPDKMDENAEIILRHADSNADDEKFAHLLKCRSRLMVGNFEGAIEEADLCTDSDMAKNCRELQKFHEEATAFLAEGNWQEAGMKYNVLLENCPLSWEIKLESSEIPWQLNQTEHYMKLTDELEDKFPYNGTLFYRRGIVNMCNGNMNVAQNLFDKATKVQNITQAQKALKKLNSLYPEIRKSLDAKKTNIAEQQLSKYNSTFRQFCSGNSKVGKGYATIFIEAVKQRNNRTLLWEKLDEALDAAPEAVDLLLMRGEHLLHKKEWDRALFDLTNAQRHEPQNQKINKLLQKAQEEKKKADHVDHYAILNLTKGSGINQVKEAYKKLVRTYHPDRFSDKKKKKEAEEMMKKVNKAYDILSDPRTKKIYDAGGDPETEGGMNMNQQNMDMTNPLQFIFQQFAQGAGAGAGAGGDGGGFQFHFNFA